jgi:TetR/AcrR family transcriptional regulator, cholesterol catabolism regulator
LPSAKKSKPSAQVREDTVSGIARRRDAAKVDSSPEYLLRRQQVLEAAVQIFRRKGYSRTRLAEVANAAGIDRANIYYYVANKQELFLEVLKRYLAFEVEAHLDVATGEGSAADRLRALMIDLMQRYHEHYPYAYVPIIENTGFLADDEETADLAMQINTLGQRQFRAIRQVLKEGVDSGEFSSTLSTGVLAEAVVGVLAWSAHWYDPTKSRYTGKEIGAAFADLLLNGLLSQPASTQPAPRNGRAGPKASRSRNTAAK